jgi:hypothetical protein
MTTYPAIKPIVDNSTLEIVGSIIRVKDSGITPAKLSFVTIERIATVDPSNVTSVNITVPTGYFFLILEGHLELVSGNYVEHIIGMRFNDDTGTNYDYQQVKGSGTTASASLTTSATYIAAGSFNQYGRLSLRISNYSAYSHKQVIGNHANSYSTTYNLYTVYGRWWNISANISRITLFNATNTDTFSGKIVLYGMK